MGWTSNDDMIAKLTAGKKFRNTINKITTVGTTGTAGRAYDLSGLAGSPTYMGYGEYLLNSYAPVTFWNWTANGTGFAPTSGFVKTSATGTTITADSLNIAIVANKYYRVQFTVSAWTSSNIFFTLGGVTGSNRAAIGTFVEIIQAVNTNGFVLNASVNTGVWTVTNISVVEWGASSGDAPMFAPCTQTNCPSLYTGGDVSSDTRHLLSAGMVTTAATGVGQFLIVDLLGAYPYLNANSNSPQACYNTNTLPRYTDGKGVRAFIVSGGTGYAANATTVGASAHNFQITYINQSDAGSRTIPVTVAGTASAYLGHISHAGVAANNYFPLPLANGDAGIKSIQSYQQSATTGTAGTYYHTVLYKELAMIPVPAAQVYYERDFLNMMPSLERIYDGAVLGIIYIAGGATAASTTFIGHIENGWG